MPAGYSGSYGSNGVAFTAQPTTGDWVEKGSMGFDGNGRPLYPAVGEFDLEWGLMSTQEFKQINDIFLYTQATGSVVMELPKWGDVDYLFYAYSGTYTTRPQAGSYFVGYMTNVKWSITNIRVD